MPVDVQSRRREILVLLLTALALALLVNLIANVVFVALYEKHKVLFTLLVLISTGLVALGSYLSFLTQAEKSTLTIQFPLTLNRRDLKFEDLPRSPPSVHARVFFSQLPLERRQQFAIEDANWRVFFRGNFAQFIDNVLQEIVLTLLLTRARTEKPGWKALVTRELPEGISENPCMTKEFQLESPRFKLSLPEWLEIETFGNRDRYVRFVSEFGKAELTWTVAWGQMAHYTEPFMTLTGMRPGVDYHDFDVRVTFTYDCRFSRILSSRLNKYVDWARDMEKSLQALDWEEAEKRLPLELLKRFHKLLSEPDGKLKASGNDE